MPHAVLAPPALPLAHRLCALARRHPDRLHMIRDVASPRQLLDIMDSCHGVGYEVLPVGDDRIAERTQALLEAGYHASLMRCGLRSIVVLGQTANAVERLRDPGPAARARASGLPRLRWLTLILLLLALAGGARTGTSVKTAAPGGAAAFVPVGIDYFTRSIFPPSRKSPASMR